MEIKREWYFIVGVVEVETMGLTLEDLEVLQVRVLSVDVELDTSHWDVHVDGVEDLAKSRSIACQYSALLSHNSKIILFTALSLGQDMRP